MPTITTRTNRGVQQVNQAPVLKPTAVSPDSFGAVQARLQAQFGGQLSKLGSELFKTEAAESLRVDRSTSRDVLNKGRQEDAVFMNDAFNKKGSAAKNSVEEAREYFRKQKNALTKGLDNQRQKDIFNDNYDSFINRNLEATLSHQSREMANYEKTTLAAQSRNATEDAYIYRNDPEEVAMSKTEMRIATTEQWKDFGPEVLEKELRDADTQFDARLISGYLADDNIIKARAYFEDNKERMNSEVRAKIEETIQFAGVKKSSEMRASKIVRDTSSISVSSERHKAQNQAVDDLGTDITVEERDEIKRRINNKRVEREAIEAEKKLEDIDAITNDIIDAKTLEEKLAIADGVKDGTLRRQMRAFANSEVDQEGQRQRLSESIKKSGTAEERVKDLNEAKNSILNLESGVEADDGKPGFKKEQFKNLQSVWAERLDIANSAKDPNNRIALTNLANTLNNREKEILKQTEANVKTAEKERKRVEEENIKINIGLTTDQIIASRDEQSALNAANGYGRSTPDYVGKVKDRQDLIDLATSQFDPPDKTTTEGYTKLDEVRVGIDKGTITSRSQIARALRSEVKDTDLNSALKYLSDGGAKGAISDTMVKRHYTTISGKNVADDPELYTAVFDYVAANVKTGVKLTDVEVRGMVADALTGGEVETGVIIFNDEDMTFSEAMAEGGETLERWVPDITDKEEKDIAQILKQAGKLVNEETIKQYKKHTILGVPLPQDRIIAPLVPE